MKTLWLIIGLLSVGLASAFNGNVSLPGSQPGGSALTGAAAPAQTGLSYRYERTYGTPGEPYIDSPLYLNGPYGLYMDGSDNLYIAESEGNRLLKYDSSGNLLFEIGQAGVCGPLCGPKDLALDGAGNIWVVGGTVHQFAPNGDLLQEISDSGEPAGFSYLMGIAFDSQARMFLADQDHQRVLVYTATGDTPVYSATIGETDVPGADDSHFSSPASLAVDSSDRLYVTDEDNRRVQRCSDSGGDWACTTLTTIGGGGSISWGFSVWVDSSDQVFITNPSLRTVIKCDSAGNCADLFSTGAIWSADVVTDSAGNIYLSYSEDEFTVRKYTSTGMDQVVFAGISGVPYLTDENHLNGPVNIAVDANDDFVVVGGQQLIKMDADGNRLWEFGVPGIMGLDEGHLFNPAAVSADASGKFYVATQLYVQIINSDGTYFNTLGTGCCGGDYGFFFTHGVGINQTTGTIYASDTGTDRVQVYSSSLVYQASIGEEGVPGSDNAHFDDPENIAVDQDGNIYVIDMNNLRIQKFNSARVYQNTFPISDAGNAQGNLVIDSQGRLFVAQGNRVYVYDTDGNYLATIGGENMGGFSRGTRSTVAVDSAGNVYIAMQDNHCVVKFVPGVPDWQQVNINGFAPTGDWFGSTRSMEVFDGMLYAGVNSTSAQIWRLASGQPQWQPFNPPWTADNEVVFDLQDFGAYLYAGTYNAFGAELWRTDGVTWEQVVFGGFGDVDNGGINVMAVFNGSLYAATVRADGAVQVWRSSSGDDGSWAQVVGDGFGSGGVGQGMTMDVFNGALYLGIGRDGVAELWKTTNGADWTTVFTNGLASNNTNVSAMAVFKGNFYLGMLNTTNGGSVWRSSNGNNFSPVFTGGLGNLDNTRPYGLTVYYNQLYLAFGNNATGAEVWRSPDGTHWEGIAANGWGDSNNQLSSYYDKGMVVFDDRLHISTLNYPNGSQVWRYNLVPTQVFLPAVLR